MIEYDGSKCQPHNLTRCAICLARAANGLKPAAPSTPPASFSGGPPENIEGLSTGPRDRLPETIEEANTDYDKILAEVNAIKAGAPSLEQGKPQPGSTPDPTKVSFDILPVDDSRASKVMRAAAAYAKFATIYAQKLAAVEGVRQQLMRVEAELGMATKDKDASESELKRIVTERVA